MLQIDLSSDRGEREEILRSAEEARKKSAFTVDYSQVERYLNPPAQTAYSLEYAFYLLGDIQGKHVLDLGCGNGENLIPLAERGANVAGIDISPDLIELAQKRIQVTRSTAVASVGSAYRTGCEDESVDVVFCISLIHHLDIPTVADEMWRILKKGGFIVLSEPVRFSRMYAKARGLFPAAQDVSPSEHPLTHGDLDALKGRYVAEGERYFRLPFVPLARFLHGSSAGDITKVSSAIIRAFPPSRHFATKVVLRLRKQLN